MQIHNILFLALVPKKKSPLDPNDYWKIFLVGCVYKVIVKLLASRLNKVIGNIISSSQNTFVPGRQLLEGVLMANEMVDYTKKEKVGCLLFKVDFEKA